MKKEQLSQQIVQRIKANRLNREFAWLSEDIEIFGDNF